MGTKSAPNAHKSGFFHFVRAVVFLANHLSSNVEWHSKNESEYNKKKNSNFK